MTCLDPDPDDLTPQEEAMEDARAEFAPRRRNLPRCTDRSCGSPDCPTCMGKYAAEEYLQEQYEEEQ